MYFVIGGRQIDAENLQEAMDIAQRGGDEHCQDATAGNLRLGQSVLVLRSDGKWSAATVTDIQPTGSVTVELEGGAGTKLIAAEGVPASLKLAGEGADRRSSVKRQPKPDELNVGESVMVLRSSGEWVPATITKNVHGTLTVALQGGSIKEIPPAFTSKFIRVNQPHKVCGWKMPKSVESLDPAAKGHYKQLQLATEQGGQQTFKQLANQAFKKYDKSGDGKLTLQELQEMLDGLHRDLTLPETDPFISETLFSRYDLDRSGFIEMAEFASLYNRLLRLTLSEFKVVDKAHLLRASTMTFNQKYTLGKRLNAGAQGVTYLATEKNSGKTVVVKKPNDVSDVADFEQIRDKSHPNVVRVFELFHSSCETFVVMECCSGGDLFGAVKYCKESFGNVSMEFIRQGMRQVMEGVQYLHSQFKECHNDIKPENVLLDRHPADITDVPRFMVGDFGCASGVGSGTNGDPRYNAPELWLQAPVSFASDVWALGVMIYELLSGGLLIYTDHMNISGWGAFVQYNDGELAQKLGNRITTTGSQPDWAPIAGYAPGINSLCKGMLAWSKLQRTSLPAALDSPWFQGGADDSSLPAGIANAIQQRAVHSALKMVLLNMVASKLQGENLDHYQHLWSIFDKDHSGMLTQEEFVRMLVGEGMRKFTAEDMFALADIDGSGQIDFNEFVAVMFNPDAMEPRQLQQHLCSIFQDISQGKSAISVQELACAFPGGMETQGEVIAQLFKQIDADKNGVVTAQEFETFLSKM